MIFLYTTRFQILSDRPRENDDVIAAICERWDDVDVRLTGRGQANRWDYEAEVRAKNGGQLLAYQDITVVIAHALERRNISADVFMTEVRIRVTAPKEIDEQPA